MSPAARNQAAISIVAKPRGRGNWTHYRIRIEGPFDMYSFKPGDPLDLGDHKFWIVSVE